MPLQLSTHTYAYFFLFNCKVQFKRSSTIKYVARALVEAKLESTAFARMFMYFYCYDLIAILAV